MTNPTAPPPLDAPAEQETPPFDAAVVEATLRQVEKTMRAHQLYEGNTQNPSYARSLEASRSAFTTLWHEVPGIALAVSDNQFTWFGVPILAQAEKTGDSLAWMLYKDGIREISLFEGFERDELARLLDVLPRARRAQPLDDDLLTMLWEQQFEFFQYRYVELALDGVPIDPEAQPGRWPVGADTVVDEPIQAIEEARAEQEQQATGGEDDASAAVAPPAGVVRMEDFDSSLYFLEDEEVRYLKEELQAEYEADLRRTTLDALLDIFELQVDPLVRKEVVANIDALTLHLLAGRQFANVAYLLRETGAMLERARELQPETRERLRGLADRLSNPAALSQLLQAMDESETLPPVEDLEELFLQLRPAALGTVFGWLGQSTNASLRPLLERAADRLAAANTAEVVRLITSGEAAVAMEAVRRAGSLRTPAAVGALAKVLGDPSRDLRIAAVTSLVDIATPGAMQVLERAIDDSDRDVRIAVIRALAARQHRPALARVTTAVKSRDVRATDRTERIALFELYGLLCGDAGVPFLGELLNGKSGLFSRKEDPELRACAAIALGKVRTARAQEELRKAAAEKDVVVRSAVTRGLREAPE